jgi:hypothetical protein
MYRNDTSKRERANKQALQRERIDNRARLHTGVKHGRLVSPKILYKQTGRPFITADSAHKTALIGLTKRRFVELNK